MDKEIHTIPVLDGLSVLLRQNPPDPGIESAKGGTRGGVPIQPNDFGLEEVMNRMSRAAKRSSSRAGEPLTAIPQDGQSGLRDWSELAAGIERGRYDGIARFFHWTFAVWIIYASVAGYSLTRVANGPVHDFLSRLNMSIATVLIVLFPLRVGWKLVRIAPPALPDVSVEQQLLARVVHLLIYVMIFAVLASGFLMVPNGYPFFGLVEIHTPFQKGPLTDELFAVHRASCALLVGLVMLHVVAVIKHQLISRNDVLRRML
ncbi:MULTISPECIES: cytochrome b [unclassified Paraburkholderia]|uniref:cytochrome b n=2 Tax=Paraburkholderia TaxID=1822464 RepID=UPI0034CE3E79